MHPAKHIKQLGFPQNVRLSDDKESPEIRVISGAVFVRKSMFGKGTVCGNEKCILSFNVIFSFLMTYLD